MVLWRHTHTHTHSAASHHDCTCSAHHQRISHLSFFFFLSPSVVHHMLPRPRGNAACSLSPPLQAHTHTPAQYQYIAQGDVCTSKKRERKREGGGGVHRKCRQGGRPKVCSNRKKEKKRRRHLGDSLEGQSITRIAQNPVLL